MIKEATKEMLWRIMTSSEEEFSECVKDPRLWYAKGLRNPERIFPKNQAQKKTKVLPRVISSTGLIDQLCARWFFQDFTDAETYCFPAMDTLKGIGFTDEMATLVGDKMDNYRLAFENANGPLPSDKGPVGSDVSGWDKSFVGEGTRATYHVMKSTCVNYSRYVNQFELALKWWGMSLCTNLYVTDTGRILCFLDNKVQRSGGFLTTPSNGYFRCACAYAIGSLPSANGDDCLEMTALTTEELVAAYKAIGMPIRDAVQFGLDYFEFCSHGFVRQPGGGWTAHLAAYERMFFETTTTRDITSSEVNWTKELEHHPNKELVLRFEAYLAERAATLATLP